MKQGQHLDLFLLREKSKGYATVLILGGVSEAMDAGLQDIRLTMKKRKGFVKYAMQVRGERTSPMMPNSDVNQCGRCLVCFVLGSCMPTGSKTKHTRGHT